MVKLPRKYTCYGFLAPVRAVAAAAAVWDSVRVIRMIKNRQASGTQTPSPGIFNLAALPPELYTYLEDWLIEILDVDEVTRWPFILYCRCGILQRAWTSREGLAFVLSLLEERSLPPDIIDGKFEDGQPFEFTNHPTASCIREQILSHPTFKDIADKHIDRGGDLDVCCRVWKNLWLAMSDFPALHTEEVYLPRLWKSGKRLNVATKQTIYWENLIDVFLDEHGLSRVNAIGPRRARYADGESYNLVALAATKHLPLADGLFLRRRYTVEAHLKTSTIPTHIARLGRILDRFLVPKSDCPWVVFHQPGFDKQLMATAWALCSRLCQQNDKIA